MKLSIEQVQELAELQKRVSELHKLEGFAGVGNSYVQLTDNAFVATFPTYVAVKRMYCETYSHDLSTVAGGVEFIAVTSNEEYIRGHEHEPS